MILQLHHLQDNDDTGNKHHLCFVNIMWRTRHMSIFIPRLTKTWFWHTLLATVTCKHQVNKHVCYSVIKYPERQSSGSHESVFFKTRLQSAWCHNASCRTIIVSWPYCGLNDVTVSWRTILCHDASCRTILRATWKAAMRELNCSFSLVPEASLYLQQKRSQLENWCWTLSCWIRIY